MLGLHLGGGRETKEEEIDPSVGVVIKKHVGERVKKGDILLELYQRDQKDYKKEALEAFKITN